MTSGLFILAFALGVGSWFLALIEMIAVHSFSTFFFRIGVPVYRQTIDLPTGFKIAEPNKTITKSEGKFQFTTDNKVLFLSQMFWLKMFRIKTPFPLKATGTITTDYQMNIVARLPIGTTLFFLSWLTALTVALVGSSIRSGNFSSIAFVIVPWVFVGLIVGICYYIEKGRMETMVSELQQIIEEQNANSYLSSDIGSTALNQNSNITKTQPQGGFPLKIPAAIAIVVIWNILFLLDFQNFFGKHKSGSPLGLGAQLALGFVLVTCFLLLTFEPVRRLILKEGRSIDDIKGGVFLFIFLCGFMLLMITLT